MIELITFVHAVYNGQVGPLFKLWCVMKKTKRKVLNQSLCLEN